MRCVCDILRVAFHDNIPRGISILPSRQHRAIESSNAYAQCQVTRESFGKTRWWSGPTRPSAVDGNDRVRVRLRVVAVKEEDALGGQDQGRDASGAEPSRAREVAVASAISRVWSPLPPLHPLRLNGTGCSARERGPRSERSRAEAGDSRSRPPAERLLLVTHTSRHSDGTMNRSHEGHKM